MNNSQHIKVHVPQFRIYEGSMTGPQQTKSPMNKERFKNLFDILHKTVGIATGLLILLGGRV